MSNKQKTAVKNLYRLANTYANSKGHEVNYVNDRDDMVRFGYDCGYWDCITEPITEAEAVSDVAALLDDIDKEAHEYNQSNAEREAWIALNGSLHYLAGVGLLKN